MSRYKTGHKQPRFRYSVLARCVAWANISVQVLFSTRSHLYAGNGGTCAECGSATVEHGKYYGNC